MTSRHHEPLPPSSSTKSTKTRKMCFWSLVTVTTVWFVLWSSTVGTDRLTWQEIQPVSGVCHTATTRELQSANNQNGTGDCTPQHQIVFIKTHKTASSTTASILERYGYNHNLSFAVRPTGHILTETVLFHRSIVGVDHLKSTSPNCSGNDHGFDMLTNHARYNRPEMEAVVHNAKYITILREPTAQFESAFGYFQVAEKLGLAKYDNPIEEFMKNPRMYLNTRTFDYFWQAMRNQQLFDLGLDHIDHDDEHIVNYKIATLEKELDLVMLTEYYPESIILLKKLLCWDFDNMLFLSNGVRSKAQHQTLSPELRAKIRNWNCADAKLYDHFNKTFWKRVEDYGPDFEKDLATFQQKQKELEKECIDFSATVENGREIIYQLKSDASPRCKDILRGDVSYTSLIQDRMRQNGEVSPKFSFGFLRDVYNSVFNT